MIHSSTLIPRGTTPSSQNLTVFQTHGSIRSYGGHRLRSISWRCFWSLKSPFEVEIAQLPEGGLSASGFASPTILLSPLTYSEPRIN